MAQTRPPAASGSSTLLLSAFAGAVVGATGLAWWLLTQAERRRQLERQQRLLRLSRLQSLASEDDALMPERGASRDAAAPADGPLGDRVRQLNQAIDEVRRQLEALQTPS
ncbi:MAG: hypothetical protein VKK62_05885 [Synechococcaceae cyanobacterium]|nr:hypothetical protein [Synechococcaceae cyanobacterium]